MKCSLCISNFLEEISSLSHSIVFLYFFALMTEEGFLILLFFETLHSNRYIFPFLLCFWLPFCSQLFVRPLQTIILLFCISFSWRWSWSLSPVQCHEPLSIVHQALYQIYSLKSVTDIKTSDSVMVVKLLFKEQFQGKPTGLCKVEYQATWKLQRNEWVKCSVTHVKIPGKDFVSCTTVAHSPTIYWIMFDYLMYYVSDMILMYACCDETYVNIYKGSQRNHYFPFLDKEMGTQILSNVSKLVSKMRL